MSCRVCLVHYHEIGLKGKNRSTFENQLVTNIRRTLEDMPVEHVGRVSGYVLVTFSESGHDEQAAKAISRVPGVALVSRAIQCSREQDEMCSSAVEALREAGDFVSFKVHARKSNTDYAGHTLDINRFVGSACCEAFPDKAVEMHNPDVIVTVLVSQGCSYVYATSLKGVGGLPVGTAGKVMTLLSSGIDSPVSTWMVGRRGATCVPVHFSGRPMTSDTSEYLTQDIIRALEPSGVVGRLYVVPFGDCQREISLVVPPSLRIVMYRRLMFRVAESLASIEGAKALVTGESLGQVASQTLDNIAVVNEVVSLPVLRPLIGSDKQEIIKRAQELGTYDISCEVAPDCCTLFMPRRPETHANREETREAWDLFDHDAMVEKLIERVEYIDFDTCPSYRPPRRWRSFHKTLKPAHNPQPELDVSKNS